MSITCGLADFYDVVAIAPIAYAVSKIHTQSIPREFTEPTEESNIEYIRKSIENQNTEVIKAEKDGVICGYLVLYIDEYPKEFFVDSKRGFVGSIGVDEHCRGQGVGILMIQYAENILRERGIKVFNIDVYCFNQVAEKLYDRLGFEDIKHFKRKILD